jgi:hypothetical protein
MARMSSSLGPGPAVGAPKPDAVPAAEPDAVPAAEPDAVPAAEPAAMPAVQADAMPAAGPAAVPAAGPDAMPDAVPAAGRGRTGLGADIAASRADLTVAGLVFGWITLVLLLDRGPSLGLQRLLGAATWVVLLLLLRRESPLVRCQVAVVVVFATAIEYTFSPLLEVYVYRFGNVPAFVPPGHGGVYLCALVLGRCAVARRWSTPLVALTVVAGGAYALWGLVGSSRLDVLGAFWFGCLLAFLRWGPSRLLYVGAFAIVTYLELLGTAVHAWTWQPLDPTGIVAIGNPPSGAAGGYGWFDLAGLLAGPALLAGLRRLQPAPRAPLSAIFCRRVALNPAGLRATRRQKMAHKRGAPHLPQPACAWPAHAEPGPQPGQRIGRRWRVPAPQPADDT